MEIHLNSSTNMAAAITRAASKQTYYTIRFLVDDGLVDYAYQAYAYFRWVDDWLDQGSRPQPERLAFLKRQQVLLDCLYAGDIPAEMTSQEHMLATLIWYDPDPKSGLHAYLRNMMAVMAFDAQRRGQFVSRRELNAYTRWLAVAVTEALHYFIGHNCASPDGETRYLAVTGAHITHMLRDTLEDVEAGYYNIPREAASAGRITPEDVTGDAYRAWVKGQIGKARACFRAGRDYLAQVTSFRCRFAGFAYMHRFEVVLDRIEREDYLLRSEYPERKKMTRGIAMLAWALWMALKYRRPARVPSVLSVR